MDSLAEKIADFTNMVIGEAGRKRDALMQEMDKEKAERLEKLRREIEADAESEMKRKTENIKKENNERILKTETELKKQLLIKREGMVEEIMNEVRKKLDDFIKSDKYGKWLEERVKKAVLEVGEGRIKAELGVEDANDYGERIKKAIPHIEIEASETVKDGGVLVFNMDKNICVDYSFKALLEDEESRFLQKSGLNIG